MPFKSYREESKINWGRNIQDGSNVTNEETQLGAILRIADASEKMASNYTALQNELERYKRWYETERKDNRRMANRIRSLKGVITKLKK